jgi:hypothetical protein
VGEGVEIEGNVGGGVRPSRDEIVVEEGNTLSIGSKLGCMRVRGLYPLPLVEIGMNAEGGGEYPSQNRETTSVGQGKVMKEGEGSGEWRGGTASGAVSGIGAVGG